MARQQNRPPTNYEQLVQKMIQLLGHTENRTSVNEVAAAIDEGVSAVQRAKTIMGWLGSMRVRYGSPPGGVGKASYWTITDDLSTIKAKLKAREGDWSEATTQRITREEGRVGTHRAHRERLPAVERVAVGTAADGTAMAVAGPDRVSPFFGLKLLRRDEARAMVEAARQYRDRIMFIETERARFQEMGITLNKEAITLQQDERLETIGLILSHVDALEKERDNLAEQQQPNRTMAAELQEARRQFVSRQGQIERLIAEKTAIQEGHVEEIARLRNGWRAENEEVQGKLKEALITIDRLRLEAGHRRIDAAIDKASAPPAQSGLKPVGTKTVVTTPPSSSK